MAEGGSVWRIWDLHVHTPCSWLNNQYGNPDENATWDRYIGGLENKCAELGVAALGITDYYSINGYKRLRRAQLEENRLRDVLLIPNVEFRINTFVYPEATAAGPGPAKRINLHVLFDPALDPEKIEDDFLHRLTFVDQELPFSNAERKVLNERNLRSFGQDHIEQDERFRARPPLEVACSIAVVSEDDIKKFLFDDHASLRGRALIVLADENSSEMAWGTAAHAVRQKLVQMSHAVFSGNESSREFYLGKKHSSVEGYVREFGSIKPCFWGSDAHSYDTRFLEPDQSRYLWLKCDPCWEGLRQTLFEPEERVFIGHTPPHGAPSSYTLEYVKMDCPHEGALPVRLESQTVPLNRGLVAIIGGRGSGKTALLDLLASAYSTGKQEVEGTPTSFIHRIFAASSPGENTGSIGLTYGFTGGQEFHTTISRDGWSVFEGADITYLQQNHFDSITGDPVQLKYQILKLVFDRYPQEDFTYKGLRQKTALVQQDIKGCNADISAALLELEPMPRLVRERDLHKGRIADLAQQLSDLEALQAPDQLVKEALQQKVEVAQTRSNCESILLRLDEADAVAREAAGKLATFDWARANADLLGLKERCPELEQLPANSAIAEVDRLTQQIGSSSVALTSLRQKLEDEFTKISNATASLDQHQKAIERTNLELQSTSSELSELGRQLDHMGEVQQKTDNLNIKLGESYTLLIKAHADERAYLGQLLEKLMREPDADIVDVTFFPELTVDTDKLCEEVLSLVNKNQVDPSKLQDAVKVMCSTAIDWAKDLASSGKNEQLKHLAGDILQTCSGKFRKGVTLQAFADALLSDHFHVQVQIGFKGVSVEHLSMGQRAVVLLKLVLASGDGPLLLDQPEEDLDNRYIYEELVPAIRRAKTRRQIIVATHNANLVVTADAEEVIIAHFDDGVIGYDVASLENLAVRERITQVLEGGREAFALRERKYGMNF